MRFDDFSIEGLWEDIALPNNKRSIPEIRERLKELALEHDIAELGDIAEELHRNPPVKRAKTKSPPLTPELAKKIRAFADENPNLHQQEIANHFGVNHGKVSEALNNLI